MNYKRKVLTWKSRLIARITKKMLQIAYWWPPYLVYMIWGWTWWILMYLIIWLDRKCFFQPWLRNSNCQSIPSWLRFHAYMIILLLLNLCITKKSWQVTSEHGLKKFYMLAKPFHNSLVIDISKEWKNPLRFRFEFTYEKSQWINSLN